MTRCDGLSTSAMTNLESIEEVLLGGSCTIERLCAELAKFFGVRSTEVGLLRLEGALLRFLFPPELQSAGSIPLSSSAVAARTAVTKKAELFNRFAKVPHRSFFELIRLKDAESGSDDIPIIQKLMSAPILGEQGEVLGVVQISRKGVSYAAAGPDFTGKELQELERTARRVASLMPEILLTNPKPSRQSLKFQNQHKRKRTEVRSQ